MKKETRGRKPLDPPVIRERIRDELERIFIKTEKAAFRNLPTHNGEIKDHVKQTIKQILKI